MVRKVLALLGATGSIGTSTLRVLKEQSQYYSLALMTAHQDWQKLLGLASEFGCSMLCLTGIEDKALQARIRQEAGEIKLYFGEQELLHLLQDLPYDIALNAITGSAGLKSSFSIISSGRPLALANKESLVMAGHLLAPLAKSKSLPILPVDSEHSAIFQAIGTHPSSEIRKLHITASGGSFRDLPLENFTGIKVEQALKHPNWDMGAKVTLDSATMFNKALEVMEAHWLFDLPYSQIAAVIHPQSIIHSLVEFIDGSLLAQMSSPDMSLPILYALSYPQRLPSTLVTTDLLKLGSLSFREIEEERYPLYYLGREVALEGGILPTVLNAANEAALRLFLERKISFPQIHELVRRTVEAYPNTPCPDLEEIVNCNTRVYREVLSGR